MTWWRDRTPEFTHNVKPFNFLKTKACSSDYHQCAAVWTETTDPSHKAWGRAKHLFHSKQNKTKLHKAKQHKAKKQGPNPCKAKLNEITLNNTLKQTQQNTYQQRLQERKTKKSVEKFTLTPFNDQRSNFFESKQYNLTILFYYCMLHCITIALYTTGID